LLSHPLLHVRMETYRHTLSLVKDCLGIQNVSRQESGVCSGVNFLLHHRVLYEISAFGLQDSAEKVNAAAKDILLFLLKGRLMMSASTWDRLNEALYPVIPILQGYANTEDSLGKSVLLISNMSEEAGAASFPAEAKLKAALRLLFTKQPAVRIAAVQQILPHLASAEDANTARPNLDQAVVSSLPNLYCCRNPVTIAFDTSNKSVLKVESVEKLFGVLSSDTIDISLRRSAAEQLAIVLQDAAMHPVLKNLGITDKVISLIVESVNGNKSLDRLLEPCVCVLRNLVYADSSLRHSLAQHHLLLLTLLRASLILKENQARESEIAILMSLLLFDEIATIEKWCVNISSAFFFFYVARAPFSLPLSLTRRYNIPFQAATHHAVSPFCCILPPSSDLLALPPAHQALQFAWNVAWHSGIDKLLDVLCGATAAAEATEFHPDLQLSEAQVAWLRVAHRPAALQDCIAAIVTAEGHLSVTSALSRLNLHVLVDRLALPHVPTYSCRKTLPSLSWHTAMTRLCLALAGPFKSQLAVGLLQSLRVSDAPSFYGLPSLERTLQGMVSLTAQPGWSARCPDLEPTVLCSKYLSGLLEVISSFYVEWGGNSLSFMGKGVTKNALISLLHLSHEMTSMNTDKVRCASLSLGAALSSVPSGCQALCVSCQNISGGLWGTLLNILLDQHESSMVRREAAFILQNLLVMPMPANAEEAKDSHWQILPSLPSDTMGSSKRWLEKCLTELKAPNILPGAKEDIKIQFVTQLQFLSSFSKLLQSCVTVSPDLIGQMDTLKQLLNALVAVLTLDAQSLDASTRNAVWCVLDGLVYAPGYCGEEG
ncbi:unnamed protein product, partial [Tetraodon nigroviridis]